MNYKYHIVLNKYVFDDKWGKMSKQTNLPVGTFYGIFSAIMCFAGENRGKINDRIFRFILFDYNLQDRFDELLSIFIKHKALDKNFNLPSWNKYQKNFMHNNTNFAVESVVEKKSVRLSNEERAVEFRLSLVESVVDGAVETVVEYMVDKKKDLKLYQAWYNQRIRKGLSCKASYDVLTAKGYQIETKILSQKNVVVESVVEKVDAEVEKVEVAVDTTQRAHVEMEIKKEKEKENIKEKNIKKENDNELRQEQQTNDSSFIEKVNLVELRPIKTDAVIPATKTNDLTHQVTVAQFTEKQVTKNNENIEKSMENDMATTLKNNNAEKTKKSSRKHRIIKEFTPPTLDDVICFCKERNNNVDAKQFYDYYNVNNWVDNHGQPVKNWKQKIIAVWENSKYSNQFNSFNNGNTLQRTNNNWNVSNGYSGQNTTAEQRTVFSFLSPEQKANLGNRNAQNES